MTTAQKRIAGAFVVGLGLIILAYVLNVSQDEPGMAVVEPVVVASTEPRDFIAVTDDDSDGIPDWQEALQKTEPVVLETGSTYEVPDTLTDQFAVQFFQDMVRAENYGAFGDDPEELVKQATAQFQDEINDELLTTNDIVVTNNNNKSNTKSYLINFYRIIINNAQPVGTPDELTILNSAYQNNDVEELKALEPHIKSYERVIAQTKALPVPSDYADIHLDYLNVINALYNDVLGMEETFSDPLYTFLRMKRYPEDLAALSVVLGEYAKRIEADDIVINPEDLGQ